MTEFTPFQSLAGGGLIGVSAVLLMLFLGRIAGISGIVSGLLPPLNEGDKQTIGWKIAFILGLILAPVIMTLVTGQAIEHVVSSNKALLIIAGVCVGIGVGIGSGCTSGHGVCGIPRLSMRSIIATMTFMSFGIITVFIIRHVIGG